ncbi:nucleotidyltransferase domain-containing protein [Cellulosilyticum ruminicola]|uniref:nucleotidyltransferase domain-containing protein n=1 Tax=Cellulosilyticum ruminicola TaxID=425254 RepID=UPI0006D0CF03|nr:nucleotidyltransferase family protein [Cellulosilyticum ruminicola]
MKPNEKLIIQYLIAALKVEKCESSRLTLAELDYLYTQGCAHQIQTLIFSALDSLKTLQKIAPELMTHWTKEMVMRSYCQKENLKQVAHILKQMEHQGILVIPLKGVFLRNLYPRPDLRLMGDADLLVHQEDLDKVKQLLIQEGYEEVIDTHSYHVAFTHSNYMSIEVHWALTNHRSFNAPAAIAFEKLVFEHAVPAIVGDAHVLSLSLEDEFIYICMHMAKHLNYAGFGLRQLCDFYLVLKTNSKKYDWDYLTKQFKDIGLYHFVAMQVATCNYLFDSQLSWPNKDFPQYTNAQILTFIEDLFQSGVCGQATYHRSLAVTFTKCKGQDVSYATSMYRLFFPKFNKLKSQYTYLETKPYLVVIAWFNHIYYLLTRTDRSFIVKVQALVLTRYSMHKRKQLLKLLKL